MLFRSSGVGDATNGLLIAILGTAAWCPVVLAGGWLRFARGDLK